MVRGNQGGSSWLAGSPALVTDGVIPVDPVRPAAGPMHVASGLAWVGICILVLVAPFEAREPLLRLPLQELSSVELALLAVVGGWLASLVWSRALPTWRTPLTAPWIALLLAMLVAAASSVYRVNALHMVGRLAVAFTIYLVAVNGLVTPARRRILIGVIAASGALAAILVVLEYLGVGPVLRGLRLFRADIALIGGQVRAGGPFQYPTIAAMYLEVAFALALCLIPIALDSGRRGLAALVAAAVLLIAEAITLTFTRAGLLAMAATLCIVGASRYRQRGIDRAVQTLVVITLLIAVQLLTSRSFESLRLRWTTEGLDQWYRADVQAPRELTITTGSRTTVPVTLTNTGGNTWDPNGSEPFRLSYHWLLPDADRVVSWEGLRTLFPAPVPPGETVKLMAFVEAPREPGRYRLLWDVEQEHRLWFSTEPGSTLAFSHATIVGAATGRTGPISSMPLPRRVVRPGRMVLWRAAARMIADRPVFGVGPDNYRLLYGSYAGIVPSDPRVHSNNMYLEVLAGGGLAGGLAFAWLVWRAARGVLDARRRAVGPHEEMAVAGVAAACAAIALHGTLDSFLSFTPTYVLIAVTLALASTCGAPHDGRKEEEGRRKNGGDGVRSFSFLLSPFSWI